MSDEKIQELADVLRSHYLATQYDVPIHWEDMAKAALYHLKLMED